MAAAVVEGARKGAEVSLLTASEFSPEQVSEYDAIAFGCPSMGSEQLEESEFEPMFTACEGRLSGKSIALFGSYGWGDGEWMRSWEARCNDDGANLVCDSVICNEAPDEEAPVGLPGPGRGPRLRKQRGAGILHGHLLVSLNTFAPRGDLQSFAGCSILWLADTNHKRGIAP